MKDDSRGLKGDLLLAMRGTTEIYVEQSHATQRSTVADVSSLRHAIQVKKDIVSTAVLLKTARSSSRNALPESINEAKAFADKAQSLVDAIYMRYVELGESIKAQLKVMKASGSHHNIAGYFDSTSGATTVNATARTSQHLIIVPEHFSRKDHWQKLLTCTKCCETNSDRHCKSPARRQSAPSTHCKCSAQRGKNQVINLPTSPWEGSQYKLTLVVSLRAKVLLKYVFTAFVQNVAVQKHRRGCVTTCCRTKLTLLLKRCFHSILFEALSNHYIAICADQTAFKLMKRKYLRPAFEGFSRLLTLRILSSKYYRTADKYRLVLQKRSCLTALRNNKNERKLFALKSRWASSHAPTMALSNAFIGWMLALVRKNTVKTLLSKRLGNSLNESDREVYLQGLSRSMIRDGPMISRDQSYTRMGTMDPTVRSDSRIGTRDPSGASDWADDLKWMNDDAEDLGAFRALKAESMLSLRGCQRRGLLSLSASINSTFPNAASSLRSQDTSSVNSSRRDDSESGCGVNRLTGDLAQSFRSTRDNSKFVSFRDQDGPGIGNSRSFSRDSKTEGSILSAGVLKSFRDNLSSRSNRNESESQGQSRYSNFGGGDGSFIGVSEETLQDTSACASFSTSRRTGKSLLERAMELSSPVGPGSSTSRHIRHGRHRSRNDSRSGPRSDEEGIVSTDTYSSTCSTSVVIRDEVLQATRLMRRCLRYFNKLRAVRRVSRAYRRVRRRNRECDALRCLSVWRKGAEGRRTVEDICHNIAMRNGLKRALTQWVRGSLSRYRDLDRATRDLLQAKTTIRLISKWNAFYEEKKKTRLKDESLAPIVRTVSSTNIRNNKLIYLEIWFKEYNFKLKENKVISRVRLFSFKKYFKCYIKKVNNRCLLRKIFTLRDFLLTQRQQMVSTTYRLVSSFMAAWKDLTREILAIKREILALQREKQRMALMIERQIESARAEEERIEVADNFRMATVKAAAFCNWAEMSLRRRNQKSAILSFSSVRTTRTLLSFFRSWNNMNIAAKRMEENISQRVEKLSRWSREYSTFVTWKKSYEYRFHFPCNHYEKRLLRISIRNWRLMRTLRLLEVRLGHVCGVNKMYLQRGLAGWVTAWRKKNKLSYAVHLLQCTYDRVRAREALMKWPGWREWRRSEEMKKAMLLKKRARGRLLGIVGLIEREKDQQTSEESKKNALSLPFLQLSKDRLSLAERVAIEATYVLAEDIYDAQGARTYASQSLSLPESYRAAHSIATSLLLKRRGMLITAEPERNCKNYQDVRRNTAGKGDRGVVVHPSDSRFSSRSGPSFAHLDFFFESLRGEGGRAEQAVKELLLLMQMVLVAWGRAVRVLRVLRGREGIVRRIADESCVIRALRHWVSWTSTTSHRTLCWILPDTHLLPASKPSAADFYKAQRAGKFKKK